MILVDRREEIIGDMLVLPHVLVELEYGDVYFSGNRGEETIDIGIEIKKIRDLLNSIGTGRLAGHQLPGLLQEYQEVYLVVEGDWRPNKFNGEIEIRRGMEWKRVDQGRKWRYTDVWKWLNTAMVGAGVKVICTPNTGTTARTIEALYEWWQKRWDQHRSLLAMNKTAVKQVIKMNMNMGRPSVVRRVAAEIKGIGAGRSAAVAARFPTIEAMTMASIKEWEEIDGIGRIGARQAYEQIHIG